MNPAQRLVANSAADIFTDRSLSRLFTNKWSYFCTSFHHHHSSSLGFRLQNPTNLLRWADEDHPIYMYCPLCFMYLSGGGMGYFSHSECPMGHFSYQAMGSYAAEVTIRVDGAEERFHLDDMFDDSKKMYERIAQLRGKLT